jgi:hypothetical protein
MGIIRAHETRINSDRLPAIVVVRAVERNKSHQRASRCNLPANSSRFFCCPADANSCLLRGCLVLQALGSCVRDTVIIPVFSKRNRTRSTRTHSHSNRHAKDVFRNPNRALLAPFKTLKTKKAILTPPPPLPFRELKKGQHSPLVRSSEPLSRGLIEDDWD